jgi:CBS domain-containing protein
MELRRALIEETVADVGYRALVAVPLEASVREALAVMQRERVGCVVVLEGESLRGIFTERDVVVRILGGEGSFDEPIAEHMSPDPYTARVDEPIHRVLARMYAHGIRHLPVLDAGGRAVGTISVKRAVRFLTDHSPETVLNLPPEPGAFPATREGG